MPREIILGHSYYKVRPYVGMPLQCYRCQRIGHTARGCRAKIRCMVGSEEHVKEVCKATVERCANCRGSHKAKSKLCEHIRSASEMEKEKAYGIETQDIDCIPQQNVTSVPNKLIRPTSLAKIHQADRTAVGNHCSPSYSSMVFSLYFFLNNLFRLLYICTFTDRPENSSLKFIFIW